jgi:hypothetical protein
MTEADFIGLQERGEASRYRYIYAVDPDLEKSGVAILDVKEKNVRIARSVRTVQLLLDLQFIVNKGRVSSMVPVDDRPLLVVEAGWMVKDVNFHGTKGARRAQRVAHDVGENHAAGKLIVEFARLIGLTVIEHYPLKKSWLGKDGKITARELESLTGYRERTNQDVRDAILLGWTFAGFPMRVDPSIYVDVADGKDKAVENHFKVGPDGRLHFVD